jgi:hypothetical protein
MASTATTAVKITADARRFGPLLGECKCTIDPTSLPGRFVPPSLLLASDRSGTPKSCDAP